MPEEEAYSRLDDILNIYLDSGLTDKAVEYLGMSLEKNRDAIPVHEKLLGIYDKTKDSKNAGLTLTNLVDLCEKQNREDKLFQYVERAAEESPDNLSISEKLVALVRDDDPSRAVDLLMNMREVAEQDDDQDKASGYLEHVLRIEPDNPEAENALLDYRISFNDLDGAIEILHKMADKAWAEDDFAKAGECHEKVIDLRSGQPESNAALLDIYEKQEDPKALFDHLEKLSETSFSKKEFDLANDYLVMMLDINGENLGVLDKIKDVYLEIDEMDNAVATLLTASGLRINNKKYEEAERDFREVLEHQPDNFDALFGLKELFVNTDNSQGAISQLLTLAGLAEKNDEMDKAEDYYNDVINLDLQNEQAMRSLGEIYRNAGKIEQAVSMLFALSDVLFKKGDVANVETALRDILTLDSKNIPAHLKLGDHYLASDDKAGAIIEIRRAADISLEEKDMDKAKELFGGIIDIDDQDVESRIGLKNIYFNSDQADKGIEQLLSLAVIYQNQGDLEKAGGFLKEVLDHDNQNMGAFESLKEIYLEQGENDMAAELLGSRAEKAMEDGQREDAYSFLNEILDILPENIDARRKLADLAIEAKDSQGARDQLFAISDLYAEMGDLEAGEITLLEITEIEPDREEGWLKLAELYKKQEQKKKIFDSLLKVADIRIDSEELSGAGEILDEVFQIDPENIPAIEKLVEIHIASGETEKGVEEIFRLYALAMEAEENQKAIALCNRVLEIEPENVRALENLSQLFIAGQEAEKGMETLLNLSDAYHNNHQVDQSISTLNKIVEIAPENPGAHARLLEIFKDQDDLVGALDEIFRFSQLVDEQKKEELYLRAIGLDDKNIKARSLLKDIYIDTDRADLATQELITLADLAQEEQKFDEMVRFLEEIQVLQPLNRKAFKRIVDHYLDNQQDEKALAITLDFAKTASEEKNLDLAVDTYNGVLEKYPDNSTALLALKDMALADGDADKAIEYLNTMADNCADKQDMEGFETYTREIISMQPENLSAWEKIISRVTQSGDNEKAVSIIFELLEKGKDVIDSAGVEQYLLEAAIIDSENQEVLRRLKDHYKAEEQFDNAVEYTFKLADAADPSDTSLLENLYREALTLDPKSELAHSKLLDLYKDQGLSDKAAVESFALSDLALGRDKVDDAAALLDNMVKMGVSVEPAYLKLKEIYSDHDRKNDFIETCFNLAKMAREQKEKSAQESNLRDVLNVDGDNVRARLELKELYLDLEKPDDAIRQMLKLADLSQEAGEDQRRENYLLEVVELDGKHVKAREQLKNYYLAVDDSDKALEQIEAISLVAQENNDDVVLEELYRESIDILPMDETGYEKLIDLYDKQGETGKAVIELFNLMEMLIENQREKLAPEYLKRVVKLDRNNEEAHRRLKEHHIESGDKKAAIGELFALVRISNKECRIKKAEKFLREIFSLDKNNRKAKEKLAELFMAQTEQEEQIEALFNKAHSAMEKEDTEAAKEAYTEILTIDPENIKGRSELNNLYLQKIQPDQEEALDIFASAEKEAAVMEEDIFDISAGSVAEDGEIDLFSMDFDQAEKKLDSTFSQDEQKGRDTEEEKTDFFEEEDVFKDAPEDVDVEEVDVFGQEEPAGEVDEQAEEVDLFSEADELLEEKGDLFDQEGAADTIETPAGQAIAAKDEEGEAPEPEEVDLFDQEIPTDDGEDEEVALFDDQPAKEAPDSIEKEVARDDEPKDDLLDDIFDQEEEQPEVEKPDAMDEGDLFDDLLSDLSDSEPMGEIGGDDLFSDIIQDFKSGIGEEKAKDAGAHLNLGVAYMELDSIEEAVAEFERALALGDPEMEFTLNKHLGECYASMKKFEQAAQYLHSALDEAEENDIDEREKLDLMVDLAQIYIDLLNKGRALDLLELVDKANSNYRGVKALIKKTRKTKKNKKEGKKSKKKSKKGKKGKKGDDDDNVGYV